jgi:hypothetical protein
MTIKVKPFLVEGDTGDGVLEISLYKVPEVNERVGDGPSGD